jgi:uncharacterized protein
MEKTQIVFIHGGNSFDTSSEFYDYLRGCEFDPYKPERIRWRNTIATNLSASHESHFLQMPNAMNADYIAWAIWFEKMIPFMLNEVILVGHSLGGGFLLRYLTENKLSVTIAQLHLVSPCIDERDCPGIGGFKINIETWTGFASNITMTHLWHSSDDTLVPVHHSERFVAKYPTSIP